MVGNGSYSAWGTPDRGSVTLNGFGFTGEQVDPESGLVYLRNRYLDPAISRFLTPDPLGALGSGVNLYAYVGNNPATFTDPSGLDGCFDPVAANGGGCVGGGDSLSGSAGGEGVGGGEGEGGARSEPAASEPESSQETNVGTEANCPYVADQGRGPGGAQGSQGNTAKLGDLKLIHSDDTLGPRSDLSNLSDEELLDSVTNPSNNDPVTVDPETGRVFDGNGRVRELQQRVGDPDSSINWDTPIPYEPYRPGKPY